MSSEKINSLIHRTNPRNIKFDLSPNPYAAGSVIAHCGNTSVYISVTIDDGVPPFLKGKGQGWLTAEYSMLPSSTHSRIKRERTGASGRTQEIQRLIGRAIRAIIDLNKIGERTIQIDCDVLVADGGTRTTSITGAYVALMLAIQSLLNKGVIAHNPIREQLAAISVGLNAEGQVIADLNYDEDSSCEVDMNIVMTKSGKFIELQGTAEGDPFSSDQMFALISCAQQALEKVFIAQNQALQMAIATQK